MKMKQLAAILVVAIMAVVMCGAGFAAIEEGQPVTLVLGHTNPESDTRQDMCVRFAELVSEKTNGLVTIDIYAGGTLGSAKEEMEGLRMRTQDILVEGYTVLTFYSDLGMDNLPYLYRDYEHFMKCWYDSPVGDMWIQYAADAGFTFFGPSYRGFRMVTSMKPFTTPEEVAGLKIRTPSSEPFVSTWTHLGAQATPMDLSEVLTGLQQGTIEAQENPVLLSYSYGFADVVKYLIKTNHVCGADIFMMDSARFNELPESYQTALIEAAEEAAIEISQVNVDSEQHYIDLFAEKGVEVIEPDMDAFKAVYEGFAAENFPQMAEIVEMINAVE